MRKSSLDWHNRYSQQASWTKGLRDYLFTQINLPSARRILEVGCGTGALLADMETRCRTMLFGLDLNLEYLRCASQYTRHSPFIQADAHVLPFPDHAFDITYCHFLLLWVKSPVQVISEMLRVTRPGGHVLALAEPDYEGRIDYPFELEQLGLWQQASLQNQGADPKIGRQLAEIFTRAGLVDVQTGLLGGEWKTNPSDASWVSEWDILEQDLSFIPQDWNAAQVEELKKIEQRAQERSIRILFVPTFYAWGRK